MPRDGGLCLGRSECIAAQSEVMQFVGPQTKAVPLWLAITYLSSNVVLNSLNFYWFGKMIETVRKRFDGSKNKKDKGELEADGVPEMKAPKNNIRETGRRRGSSMVLEVADGLEKDERFGGMMDGVVELPSEKMDAEQRRGLEEALEEKGRSSALENHSNNDAVGGGRGGAARRR